MNEFDIVNGNPENNSDLDDESGIDPRAYITKDMVMENAGVSSANFMTNSRIKLSIVGKPNVGKSSLVNALLEEQRVLVHDQPHTTTDAIGVNWVREGVKYRLIDTAGLERNTKLRVGPSNAVGPGEADL